MREVSDQNSPCSIVKCCRKDGHCGIFSGAKLNTAYHFCTDLKTNTWIIVDVGKNGNTGTFFTYFPGCIATNEATYILKAVSNIIEVIKGIHRVFMMGCNRIFQ